MATCGCQVSSSASPLGVTWRWRLTHVTGPSTVERDLPCHASDTTSDPVLTWPRGQTTIARAGHHAWSPKASASVCRCEANLFS